MSTWESVNKSRLTQNLLSNSSSPRWPRRLPSSQLSISRVISGPPTAYMRSVPSTLMTETRKGWWHQIDLSWETGLSGVYRKLVKVMHFPCQLDKSVILMIWIYWSLWELQHVVLQGQVGQLEWLHHPWELRKLPLHRRNLCHKWPLRMAQWEQQAWDIPLSHLIRDISPLTQPNGIQIHSILIFYAKLVVHLKQDHY